MGGAAVGWSLAGLAFVVGWWQYGWHGLALAATIVVFWLLLQFNRTLRLLRRASSRPVGNVASAVMLHARLKPRMRLADVIGLTGSLGHKLGDDPERFGWSDSGGDRVEIEFVGGRSTRWHLLRAADTEPPARNPA